MVMMIEILRPYLFWVLNNFYNVIQLGSSWGTRPRSTGIDGSDGSDSDDVIIVIVMKIRYFDHILSGFFITSIMSFNFGSSWGTRPRSTGNNATYPSWGIWVLGELEERSQ
jgi:hypothetical protein